jgi:hypothetical protein
VAVWPGAGAGGGIAGFETLDGDGECLLAVWLVCRDSGRC